VEGTNAEPELPTLPESGQPPMYGMYALDIPTSQPEPNGDDLFPDTEPEAPRLTENDLRNTGYRWIKIGGEWHLYDAARQELGVYLTDMRP